MPKGRSLVVCTGIGFLVFWSVAPALADPTAGPLFYDQRRLPDMEVERRNQEVLNEQRRAEDEHRRDAEAAARQQAETAKQAETERRIAAEAETARKADEEKRIVAEAEAKRKADEEKRIAAEADAKRKADEERRIAAEADAKRKADDEKRIAAEADAKRKADDEKRIAAEADAKRKADDEKRIAAEADAKRKADDEKRIAAEADARRKADEEKRLVAEADAKRKADEEKRIAAEAEAKKKAEAQARTAAEAAEAKRKASEDIRLAAEAADAKRKATEQVQPAVPAPAPARVAANVQPQPAAGTSSSCGAAKIDVSPVPGGVAQISVDSACRHGQIIVVHYGSYDLTRKLGPNGQLVFALDMFLGGDGELSVGFADGSAQTVTLPTAELKGISKVALIWQAPVDLDLHAFENGASFGKPGHRWQGAASGLEAAKAEATEAGRGAGYLSTADAGTREGTKFEVYTFVHNSEQDSGAVSFVVDYASRGATPSGDKCGTGGLAEVAYDVVILDHKGRTSTESGIVPAAACGSALTANARYPRGSVTDLRFKN